MKDPFKIYSEQEARRAWEQKAQSYQQTMSRWFLTFGYADEPLQAIDAGTGLLNRVEHEYQQMQLALLMENQRIMNETQADPQFGRCSISLVRHIFDPERFCPWNWVSIQTHRSPADLVFWQRGSKITDEANASKSRRLQTRWNLEEAQDLRFFNNLDAEAELVSWQRPIMSRKISMIAHNISAEITDEILKDLRNNVGKTIEHKYEILDDFLNPLDQCERKFRNMNALSRRATFWMVTTRTIAERLCRYGTINDHPFISHAYQFGTYGAWDVYVENAKKDSEILLGCKDGDLGSGYTYAPYLAVTKTPAIFDPNSFIPTIGIITRYSKRLWYRGDKYFTKIKLQ